VTDIVAFRRFAERAAAGITAPTERLAAQDELYDHAVSAYEELVAEGVGSEEAVQLTLAQLGDPKVYLPELAKAHLAPFRPRTVLLILLLAAVVGGLLIGGYTLLFGI
jgi:hypothetical protein